MFSSLNVANCIYLIVFEERCIYTSLLVAERLRASSASNSSSGSGVRTELNILVIILAVIGTTV